MVGRTETHCASVVALSPAEEHRPCSARPERVPALCSAGASRRALAGTRPSTRRPRRRTPRSGRAERGQTLLRGICAACLLVTFLTCAAASAQNTPPEESPSSPDPKAASLIRQLADEQWEVRERATSSLIEMGAACAPQVVEAMRGSESPEVRSRARQILIAIGEWRQAPELVEEKVRELLTAIRDMGEGVTWVPAEMSQPLCYQPAIEEAMPLLSEPRCIPVLAEGFQDPEPAVRSTVAWCLGRTHSSAAVSPLQTAVKGDGDETVRLIALWSLGVIGDRTSAPSVTEALGDPSPAVRCAAAIVAERLCERATLPLLLNALEAEEAPLRYHAFYTLTRLTGQRFGYNAYAKAEQRTGAVAAWRTWWREHGAAFEPGRPSVDIPSGGEKPK